MTTSTLNTNIKEVENEIPVVSRLIDKTCNISNKNRTKSRAR